MRANKKSKVIIKIRYFFEDNYVMSRLVIGRLVSILASIKNLCLK